MHFCEFYIGWTFVRRQLSQSLTRYAAAAARLILSGYDISKSCDHFYAAYTFGYGGYLSSRASFQRASRRVCLACRNRRSRTSSRRLHATNSALRLLLLFHASYWWLLLLLPQSQGTTSPTSSQKLPTMWGKCPAPPPTSRQRPDRLF